MPNGPTRLCWVWCDGVGWRSALYERTLQKGRREGFHVVRLDIPIVVARGRYRRLLTVAPDRVEWQTAPPKTTKPEHRPPDARLWCHPTP